MCVLQCGNVTEAVGRAWNLGKAKVLQAATAMMGAGPYYANGGLFTGAPGFNVASNMEGKTRKGGGQRDHLLWGGDPRDFIVAVNECLSTHMYCFVNSEGDQRWTVDPNSPIALQARCTEDCLARFLLGVEKGVILGTEGWDELYDKPLGDPLGPAVFTPKNASAGKPATLTRHFKSGTHVIFSYSDAVDSETGKPIGRGAILWGGGTN